MEFHLHSNVAQVIQTFAPENSIKQFKINTNIYDANIDQW